jgi:hypothetical protein
LVYRLVTFRVEWPRISWTTLISTPCSNKSEVTQSPERESASIRVLDVGDVGRGLHRGPDLARLVCQKLMHIRIDLGLEPLHCQTSAPEMHATAEQ